MTVPPASQLTSRIVPASTLRRKDATMIGRTKSTPITMAATTMRLFMGGSREEESSVSDAHDATTAGGVDFGDAEEVAAADASAERPVIGSESCEQLYDLSIHLDGDEPLPVRVEAGHGAGLVLDRTLESGCRCGFEPEEKAPDGAHQKRLECSRAENGRTESPRLAEGLGQQSTAAETDHEGEQDARREKRLHPRRAVLARM